MHISIVICPAVKPLALWWNICSEVALEQEMERRDRRSSGNFGSTAQSSCLEATLPTSQSPTSDSNILFLVSEMVLRKYFSFSFNPLHFAQTSE